MIIFVCGNLAGAYHKHLMELALQQTYQDTCNCIKSRIKLEFEKRQQVKGGFELSVIKTTLPLPSAAGSRFLRHGPWAGPRAARAGRGPCAGRVVGRRAELASPGPGHVAAMATWLGDFESQQR